MCAVTGATVTTNDIILQHYISYHLEMIAVIEPVIEQLRSRKFLMLNFTMSVQNHVPSFLPSL
jgi:hypothetical protein